MKKTAVVLFLFVLAPAAFTLSKSEKIILNQWEERCTRECRVKRQGNCNRLRGLFNHLENSLRLEDRHYDKHRKAHPGVQKQITRVRSDIRRLCPSATSRYERDLNYARHRDRRMRRDSEPAERNNKDKSDPLKYRQKSVDERYEYRDSPERRITPSNKSDNPLMRRQEPVDRDDKSDPLKYRQKPYDERYEYRDSPERRITPSNKSDNPLMRRQEPVDRDDKSDPLKYRQKPYDERYEYRDSPERRITPSNKSDNPLMRRQEPVDRDDKSDPLKYRQKPHDGRNQDKHKKRDKKEKKFNPLKGRAY